MELILETSKGRVSAIADQPDPKAALLVVASGAGSNLDHPMLEGISSGLVVAGIGCMRFNFPYREQGRKAPDRPPVLQETWRAAFEAAHQFSKVIWAGGKSMGGRIASMCAAEGMEVAGLVFFGYPLHPLGKPERLRDAHLYGINKPMLFIQGSRDNLARAELIEEVTGKIGSHAVLDLREGADHSFKVSGARRSEMDIGLDLASAAAAFIKANGKLR